MASNPVDESIARLDVARARRVGQMLVTREDPTYDLDPAESLLDVEPLSGRELLDQFAKEYEHYSTTPFDPDGDRLRLYRGGVTVWSGFPGAGKTTLLRQCICHLLHRGSGVFDASLEEHPQGVLVRLAGTAAGAQLPNEHQMQWFIDAYGPKFRLWGRIGLARHRQLLAVIRKLADQGVVQHAFIDSLMCLDINNGDFEAQRQFANLVASTARASGVHIHLVAHPRKLISADQEPDINDVAGAREIGGIADNVIFVRRAKNETTDPHAKTTGMVICVRKQRHWTGALGDIPGWFHRDHRQFNVEQFPKRPTRYLPADAYT